MKLPTKYVSKGEWFDAGTEVELIDDYRLDAGRPMPCGLFRGLRNGTIDEEMCGFDEFEIIAPVTQRTE